MTTRAHIFFSGKVQGVYFRAHTEKRANRLDLCGWVRNLPDGRVEAVLEGSRSVVEEIIEYCSHSQPYARVDGVEVYWQEPEGEKDFRVLY